MSLVVPGECFSCSVRSNGFCNVSPSGVEALNAVKLTAIHPKASRLFTEGDMPRAVFILCSGRAKVTTSSAEGKTLIMRIAGAGEVLGVSATILGQPYEVSAETIEPMQISLLKPRDFLRLLHTHADLALNAVRQLSAKYHTAQREIRSLGLAHNTAEKLARLLLDWCGSGSEARLLYTHEEIAQMIGSTRETVTRVLGDFRHDHVIEVSGASMTVLDRRALDAMIST
ncbi:MAG TPA: Crp/Fnr family transcriptional regulator [Thermoanaerobaculia bacterium]|nr:Crp/Fnr family transcriptional regulator [Thermoanaerobaculia bacterium]